MTETDQTFENANPGYYIFEPKEIERKCALCHKKFTTNLSCNRFCSRAHQLAFIRSLTTTGQSPRQFSGAERPVRQSKSNIAPVRQVLDNPVRQDLSGEDAPDRGSDSGDSGLSGSDAPPAQKFDKKKYQRELMQKRRAEKREGE